MLFLFRSFTLAIIAVFINAAAVFIMLGFTGYMGISLNSITVLAGSIAFGVAVDDSIHLISQFQIYRKEMPKLAALQITYEKKNRAVIGTSLLVIFTAVFLWMIDFAPISNFGLVTIVSMSAALLLNLFVLPFCLRMTK
jgi:predicted RND superfamily exporter protein